MSISLRNPKTQKIIAFCILGLGLLYVYLLTDVVPFTYKAGAAELDDLSADYKKLSSDLTKARQTVNRLPYLEKESRLLHERWNTAQRLLPDQQEVASLLRAITLMGDQSGVAFVLFRPLPPLPAQHHTEHPIEIKVEGGYHELATFLSGLANMERILTVTDLTMEVPKSKTDSGKPAVASFVAKTFTLGGTGVRAEESEAEGEDPSGLTGLKKKVTNKLTGVRENTTAKLSSTSRGEVHDE
jgi:type IV pilus assembly protein PilO